MRTLRIAASLAVVLASLTWSDSASAQCRTLVVGGPRVQVIAPCMPAPPPVVVRVVPVPAPPTPPPPPVAEQPCPAPPPPPVVHRRYRRPQLFTLGMFAEGTMFKDGGLGGGAVYAQLRVSRALHLYASFGANASCTNCHPNDPNRVDLKTTFGLQYYFLHNRMFSPYLRGTMVYQAVNFHDPNDPEGTPLYKANQLGVEAAAGLEWKVTRWLILGADVAYIGLKRMGDDGSEDTTIPVNAGKGVATVNNFDNGATFRFNLAIRF